MNQTVTDAGTDSYYQQNLSTGRKVLLVKLPLFYPNARSNEVLFFDVGGLIPNR
jgi:hypothetical protein